MINNFEREIEISSAPLKNILQSILAELYTEYYSDNEDEIEDRTKVAGEQDFVKWDSSMFLARIISLYKSSLANKKNELQVPIDKYHNLLEPDSVDRKFRPFLFDLLAHRALNFFYDDYYEQPRGQSRFRITNPEQYYDTEQFLALDLITNNSSSFIEQSLSIYQSLISQHKTDQEPYAYIDILLEKNDFLKREVSGEDNRGQYLLALKKLAADYRQHEISTIIDFKIAEFLNLEASDYAFGSSEQKQFKKREAYEICEEAIQKFPDSFGAQQCKVLIQDIESPFITLQSEAYVLPNQPTKLRIEYKNYDTLNFSTHKLAAEDYGRFVLLRSDSSRLSFLDSLGVHQSWSVIVKNEGDFQRHSTEVLFPAHGHGSYLITVYSKATKAGPLAYALIQATNLAIVRTENSQRTTYKVIDRNNGAPVWGVEFNISSDYRNTKNTFEKNLITNNEGEVTFTLESNNYSYYSIQLKKGVDSPRFSSVYLYTRNNNTSDTDEGYTAKISFFTDRAIYRPGQEVFFKAILIKQTGDKSEVVANEKIFVQLYDPNNEVVDSLSLLTNEFGSISGQFNLPSSGLTGEYYLKVNDFKHDSDFFLDADDLRFNQNFRYPRFSVEEYKRPKFEVEFKSVNDTYQINDSLFVEGNALAFAGSSVSNAKVKYSVHRSVSFDNWDYASMGRYPSSRQITLDEGEVKTDLNGKFIIPFQALIDSSLNKENRPVFKYTIKVDVIDINGETQSAETDVKVGYHTLNISMSAPPIIDNQSDQIPLFVNAESLNGAPQPVKGKLIVHKLIGPTQVKRSALWEATDYTSFTKNEHEKLFPNLPFRDETKVSLWPKGKAYFSDSIQTSQGQPLQFEDFNSWPAGQYLVTFRAKEPSGEVISVTEVIEVTDIKNKVVADNKIFSANTDQKTYLPGETVKFTYGTAAEDLVVTIFVKRGDEVVKKLYSRLSNESKTLEIPITEKDRGGFSIFYFYAAFNDFKTGKFDVDVPFESPKLNLEVGTFRDKLQPGQNEKWSFKINGEDGEKTSAEILASMYDASLDQFSPNQWAFSPFNTNRNYSQNPFNNESSFGLNPFRTLWYYTVPPVPKIDYDHLAKFGLDLEYTEQSNRKYLNELRWRNNPFPVITAEKNADIKEGYIAGTIIDEIGLALPNVTVVVNGNRNATSTDERGYFEITAKSGDQVTFRFLGYNTYQLTLGEENYFRISLRASTEDLGEYVVTSAQGVSRDKRSLGFSVAAVADDEVFLMVERG